MAEGAPEGKFGRLGSPRDRSGHSDVRCDGFRGESVSFANQIRVNSACCSGGRPHSYPAGREFSYESGALTGKVPLYLLAFVLAPHSSQAQGRPIETNSHTISQRPPLTIESSKCRMWFGPSFTDFFISSHAGQNLRATFVAIFSSPFGVEAPLGVPGLSAGFARPGYTPSVDDRRARRPLA